MSLLDEPADIHAEIGTKTWARGLARAIRCNAEKLDSDVQHIQDFICIAAEHDAWKVLGYVSLDAFLISEANFTEAIIEAIRSAKSGTVADAIEEAKANKDKQQGKRNDLTSTKFVEVGSTNKNENILRRLARDQPELLDKIETGELTINQAAIAAGIRKKPSHRDTALKAFRRSQDRTELLSDILSAFIASDRDSVPQEARNTVKRLIELLKG
jgi:hypothetical protein